MKKLALFNVHGPEYSTLASLSAIHEKHCGFCDELPNLLGVGAGDDVEVVSELLDGVSVAGVLVIGLLSTPAPLLSAPPPPLSPLFGKLLEDDDLLLAEPFEDPELLLLSEFELEFDPLVSSD